MDVAQRPFDTRVTMKTRIIIALIDGQVPMTYTEMGALVGVTRQRVQYLIRKHRPTVKRQRGTHPRRPKVSEGKP